MRIPGLLALLLIVSVPAQAEELVGRATVIDGDTLEIQGERVRLHGIDAPESAQLCKDGAGAPYRCGQRAALALADRIGAAPVGCAGNERDRYGRLVAVCSQTGHDLNSWLVSEGLAVAYVRYSRDYEVAELAARVNRRGLWAGEFQMPWDFRRGQGSATQSREERTEAEPPIGASRCAIKGNIDSKGERIYHVPGGRSYGSTRINTSKGDRWFCSETEARAAGWRLAK